MLFCTIRTRRLFLLALVLAVTASLLAPVQARADFELYVSTNGTLTSGTMYYSTDGGNTFWTGANNTGTDVGHSIQVDGFSIFASSSSSIATSISSLDVSIQGNQTAGQSYNFLVAASLTGITTAPPPQNLNYAYTTSTSPTLTQTDVTYVDSLNRVFGGANLGNTPIVNTGIPAAGNVSFSVNPLYSLAEVVSVSGTGSLGGIVSIDARDTITPTPAPAGLVLLLTSSPVLALGAWIRRKRNRTAR
jgi:hypothetical protein